MKKIFISVLLTSVAFGSQGTLETKKELAIDCKHINTQLSHYRMELRQALQHDDTKKEQTFYNLLIEANKNKSLFCQS
jgi:hypothetical protein